MIDRRFPFMVSLDRPVPGLSDSDRRAARAAASAVCSRTGVRAAFDIARGKVYFYWRDLTRGVHSVRYAGPGSLAPHVVDDIVRYIQLGTVPRRIKDRWAAEQERAERQESEAGFDRYLEDKRPEVEKRLRYAGQKRGMGSKWQKSAVVDGLKGG
jgi:hypothetical protein